MSQSEPTFPRSAYDKAGGMRYLARMLDKIRLHAAGKLSPDYHANLGKGADKFACDYLRVNYDDVKKRTLEGGTDDEIIDWCFKNGRELNTFDIRVWNSYISKLGWNDFASEYFTKLKQEAGFGDRDEIQTMFDLFDYDEGRKK